MDLIKIGAFIAQERKAKGLTQKDLSDKLMVTDRAVSKWECGKGLPDATLMVPLCEVLEITVSELLNGESIESKDAQEKAEKTIVDLIAERQASKRQNWWQVAIVVIGLTVLMGSILLAAFHLYLGIGETWVWILTLVLGILIVATCVVLTTSITLQTGSFECQNCRHRFMPTAGQYLRSVHHLGKRRFKCPKCDKKTWCKPMLNK